MFLERKNTSVCPKWQKNRISGSNYTGNYFHNYGRNKNDSNNSYHGNFKDRIIIITR